MKEPPLTPERREIALRHRERADAYVRTPNKITATRLYDSLRDDWKVPMEEVENTTIWLSKNTKALINMDLLRSHMGQAKP